MKTKLEALAADVHTLASDCNQSAIAEGEIGLRGMCIDARNRLIKIYKSLIADAGTGEGG